MRIRTATRDDVALILAFIRELADYERLSHEVVATEASLLASLFASRPAAEVVIAELDFEPVGFAVFFANYSTFRGTPGIYLEDLYVRPAARSRGVGRSLFGHLAQLAVQRGCARLEWAVLDWNEDAISFYRTLGAQAMTDWTTYRLSGDALAELGDERTGLS